MFSIFLLVFLAAPICFGNIRQNNTVDGEQISALWKELQQTNAKLQMYQDRCEERTDIRTKMEQLKNDFEYLKTCMAALNSGFEEESHQKRLLQSEDILHQVQVDIQNLKSQMVAIQTKVGSGQKPEIGFTAVLKNDVVNLGDNQIIIFDAVYTNLGNRYNPHTGVFTCDVPGMYVFYVHTLAEPGKHLETEIVKNQVVLAMTYAYDKESFSSGSNMAVTNLQKDDTVFVRSHGSAHDHTGSIIDFWYSSFSGFLVQTS